MKPTDFLQVFSEEQPLGYFLDAQLRAIAGYYAAQDRIADCALDGPIAIQTAELRKGVKYSR